MAQFTKIVLYARFSSVEQKEGMSLQRQLGDMRRYCASKGWQESKVITDEGRSAFHGQHRHGGDLGRFEAEALTAAHQGSLIIVERLDRLSRGGHDDTDRLITGLNSSGVSVATVDGDQLYLAGAKHCGLVAEGSKPGS